MYLTWRGVCHAMRMIDATDILPPRDILDAHSGALASLDTARAEYTRLIALARRMSEYQPSLTADLRQAELYDAQSIVEAFAGGTPTTLGDDVSAPIGRRVARVRSAYVHLAERMLPAATHTLHEVISRVVASRADILDAMQSTLSARLMAQSADIVREQGVDIHIGGGSLIGRITEVAARHRAAADAYSRQASIARGTPRMLPVQAEMVDIPLAAEYQSLFRVVARQ